MANVTFTTPVHKLAAAVQAEHNRRDVEAANRLRRNAKRSKPRQPGTGPKVVQP